MQIPKISHNQNNQPAFQMNYKTPSLWNKKLLSYVVSSKLVKEIDAKYPNASVKMKTALPLFQRLQYGSAGVEFNLGNGQKFSIIADKKNINTFDEYYSLFNQAGEKVYNTTLADVEPNLMPAKQNVKLLSQKSFIQTIKNFIGLK